MGIERSTDPTGFTPANPLSVTSCIDMRGPCAVAPRISIRESCKQLIWSTGGIESYLPVEGQTTIMNHEWKSDGNCDRRMRCVDGPCKWTVLAREHLDRISEKTGVPIFQRRESSPQIGLEVQYPNNEFSPDKFLVEMAKLIRGKGHNGSHSINSTNTDPKRLQILYKGVSMIKEDMIGTTFAVRRWQWGSEFAPPFDLAQCVPETGRDKCRDYNMIISITSDGPNRDPSLFKWSLDDLALRACSPKGDPEFRKLNLMRICFDERWDTEGQHFPATCIKVCQGQVCQQGSSCTGTGSVPGAITPLTEPGPSPSPVASSIASSESSELDLPDSTSGSESTSSRMGTRFISDIPAVFFFGGLGVIVVMVLG